MNINKKTVQISPAIVIHGGAGNIKYSARHRKGIRSALSQGYTTLRESGSSLSAVVKAVSCMEELSVFNCGRGSVPSLTGEIEMDASVMCDTGTSGGVASITGFLHPIQIAHAVMKETDHRLLAGKGAITFALRLGMSQVNLLTPERERLYNRAKQKLVLGQSSKHFKKLQKFLGEYSMGTVGAVAIDDEGSISVATSTGGMLLHLPGRVGDSSIIGAGTYAGQAGGISLTGHGEAIMKELVAWRTYSLMKQKPAQLAADEIIAQMAARNCSCGLICIDNKGQIGISFNTPGMSYGFQNYFEQVIF